MLRIVLPLAASLVFADDAHRIIATNCLPCHGGSTKLSGLDLSTRATMLTGGKRGAALVPGSASASLIYQFASHAKQPAMPPEIGRAHV